MLAVALTVKLKVPVVDATPDKTPFVARVTPGGNVPCEIENVYGADPPVAVRVWL